MNLKEQLYILVNSKGIANTSKWLIDRYISKSIILNASDLPDTAEYADGIEGVREALEENDLEGAINIAEETASNMLYDLGYVD